jgi:hypothetical protein
VFEMIGYFSKMYQAVPALMQLQNALGGTFVTTRNSTRRVLQRQYPDVNVEMMRRWWPTISKGYQTLSQSDMIVTGSPNNSLLKQFSAKKAMVFHGTFAPLSVEEAKKMAHFDLLCVIGPRMMSIIEHAGLGDKAQYCGYLPFLEHPAKSYEARKRLMASLGLNPEQPLILYLPCGRPIGSWDLMAEKLLREIPSNFNLILRPHPSHSVTARFHDTLGFMRLKQLIKERGNAYLDLTAQKLAHLYSHANLVISDGTSPAEESLYYDVPQLFVETERYGKQQARAVLENKNIDKSHIDQVIKIYDCGSTISPDSQDIVHIVEDAIADSAAYQSARSWYFEYVFGEPLANIQDLNGKHHAQKQLIKQLSEYR